MLAAPGDHGGDGAAVARSLGFGTGSLLDLSASLNPFAPDVGEVIAAVHPSAYGAYPDATDATERLADAMGVDRRRLVLTNGGAEAIALVASMLGDGLVDDPEFSLYRRHLRTGDDVAGGVWRSNPSSPLGTFAPTDAMAAVWDEAFWPMTAGTWSRGDDTSWRLGSLTKLWACPGIRLGYVIAPTVSAAEGIRAAQPRWSVNGLALAILPVLLEAEDLRSTAARVGAHRTEFAAALTELGYDVRPGVAPWLLLDATPGLRETLASHGVLVRDCASFGLPDVHRIGLPRPADLGRVLEACAAVRRTSPSGH